MLLKSKLSAQYKTAEPSEHLSGSWWHYIDPVFAGRLAYLAKTKGVKIVSNSAYRSTADQTELYRKFLKGLVKSAAKPGTSWHEYRLAIDTSTQPFRGMTNAQLKAYGLCKPISSEGWHIQPIETMNSTNRKQYEPIDLTLAVKTKFGLADSTMAYLEQYKYATALFEKLLSGDKLAAETIDYLKDYEYGTDLIKKLGL